MRYCIYRDSPGFPSLAVSVARNTFRVAAEEAGNFHIGGSKTAVLCTVAIASSSPCWYQSQLETVLSIVIISDQSRGRSVNRVQGQSVWLHTIRYSFSIWFVMMTRDHGATLKVVGLTSDSKW